MKKYILLCVILYITILSPLIAFFGTFLLEKYVDNYSMFPFYSQLLGIPFWFIPLAISFTIEKGYAKIVAFILSGLYILYRIGAMIYLYLASNTS